MAQSRAILSSKVNYLQVPTNPSFFGEDLLEVALGPDNVATVGESPTRC